MAPRPRLLPCVLVTLALSAPASYAEASGAQAPVALTNGDRPDGPATAAPPADQAVARRLGELDPARVEMLRNRYHVRQMESVLVRAVEHAAEVMSHRLTTVSPDVMALAGSPRAQGFLIDGYGLFFAVEVPRLSDSMNWALQVLSTDRDERTLVSLRRVAEGLADPALRADVERAIRLLERQMASRGAAEQQGRQGRRSASAPNLDTPDPAEAPRPGAPVDVAHGAVTASSVDEAAASEAGAPSPLSDVDLTLLSNPSAAYEEEVKTTLADALLDYALTLPLTPGERVTVAARDAGFIAFPDAVTEMVTVTLSVQVNDLLAFRAQRIDREEARRRVSVREF